MFYKIQNFPPIPKELLDNLADNLHNNKIINDIGYGVEHIKNNQKLTACRYTMGDLNSDQLTGWLENNILGVESRFNILYQTQQARNNMPSTHIVHSDRERLTALNYIIDEGGEDVITSWYKENNKELFRERKTSGGQSDSGFVNYQNLELLKSAKLEKNCWYIIDTRILHDVDNITGTRKSISISFSHRNFFNE